MNDRIKELAEQVGAVQNVLAMGRHDGVLFTETELERFVELIVQECINKIETHEIPVGGSAAGEIACEMTYSALKQIRDEIKQHFGVKE
jgi:hypothetical protein